MQENDILFEIFVLHQTIIQKMMKGKDIRDIPSPTQVRIFQYMIEHQDKDIYQKDIEAHLKLSRATVSNVLNTMEKNKMIKRVINKEDARVKKVILNKSGLQHHTEIDKEMDNIKKTLINNINSEDIEKIKEILRIMKNNLNSI